MAQLHALTDALPGSNGGTAERVWLGAASSNCFPNNAAFPLVVYRGVYDRARDGDGAALVAARRTGFTPPWRGVVFGYHHYHSTAWEALLCVAGGADVQWGGPSGPTLALRCGDVALVPPGVAHKQLRSEGGFALLGSYPDHEGCRTPEADEVRSCPGSGAEREQVRRCPPPRRCPFFGSATPWRGGLAALWDRAPLVPLVPCE